MQIQGGGNDAAARCLGEAEIEAALESAGIGAWVYVSETDELIASEACARLLGLPSRGAARTLESILPLLHADSRAALATALRCAPRDGLVEVEVRLGQGEAGARWLSVKGQRRSDWPGRVAGVVIDVSAQRTVASELLDAHQRLEFHVQNSPLAVIEWDHAFHVIRWSPGAERVFGWSANEVLGKHPRDWRFVAEEDQPRVDSLMAKLLSGEQPRNVSHNRNYTKSGRIVWCDWQNSALLDEHGRLRSLLSLVLDVTAQVEFDQTRAAVLENERRYSAQLQTLARTASEIQTARSFTDLVALANERAREIALAHHALTIVTEAADGQRATVVASPLLARESAPRNADLAHALARAAPASRALRLTRVEIAGHPIGRALDGCAPGPVQSLLRAPLVGRGGAVLGAIVVLDREIGAFSEQDEAVVMQLAQLVALSIENFRLYEAELAARHSAEAADHAKDEFLATLSHELRTPLSAVLAWIAVLRARRADSATVTRAIDIIERNAKAQARIVEDILETSRIIAGKLSLAPSDIDLRAVLEASLESVRPLADAKGITLDLRVETSVAPIHADGDRLQQVFWNLLSNATKFARRGGRVGVRLAREGAHIVLQVEDDGAGIAPELLPYVFERFKQGDSSATRRHGGLGLGLAIAKHVVELHGGHIEAMSDGVDRGSTFRVSLPCAPASSGCDLPSGRDAQPTGGVGAAVAPESRPH